MAQTLTSDPIVSLADAQSVLDANPIELVNVLNLVSAKARAYMNRVQLNRDTDNEIVEYLRGGASPTLYVHAPVYYVATTHNVTVEYYVNGSVQDTWTADDTELVVTSDDFSGRLDRVSGWFPCVTGGDFLKVTYYGGWATIPGDVWAGAIMQCRIDLKRLRGEVGLASHSRNGESVQYDRNGVIAETADLWRPYRMLA